MKKFVSGGDKLDAALRRIASNLAGGAELEVGFLENARYPDGTPVAMVAAIQDGGAPKAGIPPRPFFRDMVANESKHWAADLAQILPTVNYDAAKALSLMGEEIKGELQQSIADTFSPALSPVTVMLRKMKADDPSLVVTKGTVAEARRRVQAGETASGVSTKPLVETGHLLQSVDMRVRTK
jgi:hypothetical protein